MKSIQKTSINDFQLLSPNTKRRVMGLIEMKLTPQTVMLFAQEYENYDAEIRLEIVEFIGFLMNKELSQFMTDITRSGNDSTVQIRKMELEAKTRNIKRIQEVLINPRNASIEAVKKMRETATKIPAPTKSVKLTSDDKISKMLKAAEERERILEKLERENQLKAKAKQKSEKQIVEKTPKINNDKTKSLTNTVDKLDANKKSSKSKENEEYIKRQNDLRDLRERQAREYASREAEKEKLWMELYGKSREESRRNREAAVVASKSNPAEERNKIPQIRDLKISSYTLMGNEFAIEELIDPKNKVFLFWFNTKQRLNIGNLFSFIETMNLSRQKKFFKKRRKWVSRFSGKILNPNAKVEAPIKTKPVENVKEASSENKTVESKSTENNDEKK